MEKARLYKYFSNASSESERSDIRRWVEASPDNYREFLAERNFFDTASLIAGELDETPAEKRRPLFSRWAARAAAAVALVVITLAADRAFIPAPQEPVPALTAMTVPAGQRMKVELGDGTTVWLNSNTTMRFPGAFGLESRNVEIEGEAYFAVAKDAARPFSVSTVYGDVVVTGTEFNVEAYPEASDFSLSLVEGSVNFTSADTSFVLSPGDNISYAGGEYRKGAVDSDNLEWVRGIVSFRDLPLRDILARFEKYYGVSVEFDRPDIADVRFSGKFYLEDGVEHALNVIKHDIRFNYEADKDFRKITIK